MKTNKQQQQKGEAKNKQTISKLEKQQTKERKQNTTRGSAHWTCVAHLSFCLEET
jgi:hypothetical protein